MTGILDVGRAFHTYTTLVNAAREGARYGALQPTDTAGIRDRVEQEADGSNTDLSESTVTIEIPDGVGPGNPIKVTVIHEFEPVTTLILGGSVSISTSATMIQF